MLNDIEIRDKLFDICEDTFNIKRENILYKGDNIGRRRGVSDYEIYVCYLCIIWFIENRGLSRAEAGALFNRHNSTTTKAIKAAKKLIESRNIEFTNLMDKFNDELEKDSLETISCVKELDDTKKVKLSKEELYHITFMIKNNIDVQKIATHFRVNLITIKIIKNEIETL